MPLSPETVSLVRRLLMQELKEASAYKDCDDEQLSVYYRDQYDKVIIALEEITR